MHFTPPTPEAPDPIVNPTAGNPTANLQGPTDMDTQLLALLPTAQARCREMARHYSNMGSVGCFAAALIEQALQRADRAIIDGGEDDIRAVLLQLQAFSRRPEAPPRSRAAEYAFPGIPHGALSMAPVGRRSGRVTTPMAVA